MVNDSVPITVAIERRRDTTVQYYEQAQLRKSLVVWLQKPRVIKARNTRLNVDGRQCCPVCRALEFSITNIYCCYNVYPRLMRRCSNKTRCTVSSDVYRYWLSSFPVSQVGVLLKRLNEDHANNATRVPMEKLGKKQTELPSTEAPNAGGVG